ncbi:hypothetical protein DdX_16797 [Ditylenchus destructor]|uniref:Uncharacterized protein n=1 Tax=Ditylenchus destructor TaxID=166010 RepID=A0AAD4QZR8_9BILA|nr:hypothetical protein DdX_16797 [Ditylenchus destructor]
MEFLGNVLVVFRAKNIKKKNKKVYSWEGGTKFPSRNFSSSKFRSEVKQTLFSSVLFRCFYERKTHVHSFDRCRVTIPWPFCLFERKQMIRDKKEIKSESSSCVTAGSVGEFDLHLDQLRHRCSARWRRKSQRNHISIINIQSNGTLRINTNKFGDKTITETNGRTTGPQQTVIWARWQRSLLFD